MRRPEPFPLFGRRVAAIHCLGAGGMGMAPLAIYLARLGFKVSGEDDSMTEEAAAQLAAAGVEIGRAGPDCDLVVFSSAVKPSHPGYAAAAARGLPLVRRGDMLAEAVRDMKLVAVCGSHGKTTTTAMLVTALSRGQLSGGIRRGGLFRDGSAPAAAGSNEWVVAEIDESDGTIDRFAPEITVAVNLDWDHPDRLRHPDEVAATFAGLFGRTRGTVLVSDACPLSLRLAPGAAVFGRTGGFAGSMAHKSEDGFMLSLSGRFGRMEAFVRAQGEFNAANATAALAAARLMGVESAPGLLAGFPGVRRRQSVLGEEGGITVLEDYAHHPAEIRALLTSLRGTLAPEARLIVVFQPHRHSRTAQFKAEFAASLALADRVHLLDVYSAGEGPVAGGTTADVYAEIKRGSPALPVTYLPGGGPEFDAALSRDVREGDLVAFVGAGDIDRRARSWLASLRARAAATRRWDDFAASVRPLVGRGTRILREEPLGPKTTMRVGGAARLYAEPAGEDDLRALLRAAAQSGVEVLLLGRGSNLIVPDEGVEGLVIQLGGDGWSRFEPLSDGRVRVGAGLRLKNLCGLASAAGLAGFEFLEGIPGNVGGALRMNAGAMGGWIFDVVDEVRMMTREGEVRTLPRAAMHVDYRHCAELETSIALGAVLRPREAAAPDSVGRQIDVYRRKRHETQPREPSAGCIFKNPPGASAGRLIDEAGLKGLRVGDAEISTVHANFIVNRGHATSADVLELIRRVRERVRQAKGVDLEPEVLLYGGDWRNFL